MLTLSSQDDHFNVIKNYVTFERYDRIILKFNIFNYEEAILQFRVSLSTMANLF